MAKNDKPSVEHYTAEGDGQVGTIRTHEQALAAHHLATGDPEPERDGALTGPAHELKYQLERAERSAAEWVAAGVHPFKNRALVGDEVGSENLRGATSDDASAAAIETSTAPNAPENASLPRPE